MEFVAANCKRDYQSSECEDGNQVNRIHGYALRDGFPQIEA
jgi:hypothetical protein